MNQITLNSRLMHLIIALFGGFLFWQLMTLAGSAFPPHPTDPTKTSFISHFFRVFGGSGIGYLKLVAYVAFLYGFLDLRDKNRDLSREEQAFGLGVLPEQDQLVLSPEKVQDIKLQVIDLEKRGFGFLLLAFVKKACSQYRNEGSVADTLDVLDAQMDATRSQREGGLENTRYIISTIPMLGFIGTIIELTNSLQLLEKGMNIVRAAMSGAFDATLVALLLTIILTFFYHDHIGRLDVFFGRMKGYIIDNLISRIYAPDRAFA